MILSTPWLIGCQSKNEVIASAAPEHSHVAILAGTFAQYKYEMRGKSPENETDLVAFINISARPLLDTYGYQDANELLTSKRDGKPIVFRFSDPLTTKTGEKVVAHEEEGTDGIRIIGTEGGSFFELDDEAFRQLR